MTPPYRVGTDPSTDSLTPTPSTDSYVHTYPQTDRERDQVERDGFLLSNAHAREPHYLDDSVTLWHGDCLEVMREMPDASVDAVVTDPPYGLGFMGKAWDDLPPGLPWAQECLRVLKPGGHLLAFGGTRTWHRLAVAVEDAGFEVRDSIAWLYGSGFPKSLNLTGERQGWGTALKPAFEPVVVARKPLVGTVAGNVLAHGTGALNVDGCRVETTEALHGSTVRNDIRGGQYGSGHRAADDIPAYEQSTAGRWPTNVVLDGSQADELDRQAPRAGANPVGRALGDYAYGQTTQVPSDRPFDYGDQGGASRFFPTFRYEAKAPTRERASYIKDGAGSGRVTGLGGKVRQCNVCETRAIESGASEPSCGHSDYRWEKPTTDTGSRVAHPTVKPLALMRWLVRLVTPPGGVVLEPFAGSGTTAEACVVEGFRCIAIEREAAYLPLILTRLSKPIQPDLFGGAA